MPPSLSALVPVRNVQNVLEPVLVSMLETLAELTRPVELIVIDDGSTDATIEVASEMTIEYPQIRVIRYGQARGWAEAIRVGLAEASGQILFFEEPGCRLPLEELALLWNAVAKHPVVIGRPAGAGWRSGCPSLGTAPQEDSTYQFVRRQTLQRVASRLSDAISFRQLLLQEGIAWQERIISARPRRECEILYPTAQKPESLPERTDRPQPHASPPNYLVHLVEEKVPEYWEE